MEGESKTRILMIIRSLKFGGGTEKACVNLGELLDEQGGYNVSYFSFYKDKHIYSHKGTEFCLGKESRFLIIKIRYSFIGAIKLLKYCTNNSIDIIIAYMGSGILTAILSKVFGNKSKTYIYLHRCLEDFPKWISHLLIYFSKKYTEKIIVLTEYERNYLIKYFNIDKGLISVIPNFVDIKTINNLCLEPLDTHKNIFDGNKFTFISIGRLEKIKDQELMISVFNRLNEKYENVQLIILGDGEKKSNLQKIANNNVYFLGEQENVFKFLHKSDCFLLTSKSESFSIAILEAMACDLPIISTKNQGPNEILDNEKYGILTEHNEESLYNAMEKILMDENLRKNYKEMSKKRVQNYQKENIMKLWENIINE